MMWTPWSDVRVRAAALFAAAAIVLAIVSGVAALRPDDVTPSPPLSTAPAPGRHPARRNASTDSFVALDPFGLSDTGATAKEPAANEPAPSIVLVGTILGIDQPAAAFRLGNARARILHVGDTLGGWRLAQVAPGRAVFIDASGTRHELRLSPLGN